MLFSDPIPISNPNPIPTQVWLKYYGKDGHNGLAKTLETTVDGTVTRILIRERIVMT